MWAELSFILSQFTRLTDRRTDRHRQTDSFLMARSPASMQRGKNYKY